MFFIQFTEAIWNVIMAIKADKQRTHFIDRVEESRYVESASGKNANLKIQIYNLCHQSRAAGGRMPGCDLVLMMTHWPQIGQDRPRDPNTGPWLFRARIPGQVRIGWAWSDLSALPLSWPGMRAHSLSTYISPRKHARAPGLHSPGATWQIMRAGDGAPGHDQPRSQEESDPKPSWAARASSVTAN